MSSSEEPVPDPAPGLPARRWKVVRAASAALTGLAVVALGLMAAESAHTVTKHTTVTRQVAAAAKAPSAPGPSGSASTPVPAAVTAVPSGASSLAVTTPDPPASLDAAPVAVPSGAASPTSAPAPASVSTPPPTSGTAPPTSLPKCPLTLPAPTQSGGLASLIGLSPVFGPFSAEAFASAAAFQPVLQLFGPFLVEFAKEYAVVEPSLTPLINQLEGLENEGFSVLSPLYLPYRTRVLSAETELAGALAPYAQLAASNPASSCLVDVEGMLTPQKGS
jgi:hypothetical protein